MNEQHEHDATPGQAPGSSDADAALLAELETLRNELDQLRAATLLERADLENQRKRVARDIEQARKFANERLLGDLLPVFDSLDAGLAVLDPAGEAFNPEHHQAISQADAPGAAPGSVVQVFQKGYVLNGRLLRPALVVVARHD